MLFRFIIFSVLIFFSISCNKLMEFEKFKIENLDTIVDFSIVDFSPSFKVCDTIIDKNQKYLCFRNTIHQKINKELLQNPLEARDSISEIIFIDLLINSKGMISFKKIELTDNLKKQLPELDSVIQNSIEKLPIIKPATKRGIPVNTKYRLPIKIQIRE